MIGSGPYAGTLLGVSARYRLRPARRCPGCGQHSSGIWLDSQRHRQGPRGPEPRFSPVAVARAAGSSMWAGLQRLQVVPLVDNIVVRALAGGPQRGPAPGQVSAAKASMLAGEPAGASKLPGSAADGL